MFSVGILSGEGKWPEVMAEMLRTSGSRVSGWIDPRESSQLDTRQLIDISDLIWIPEKINGGMEDAVQVIRRSRHLSLGFPVVDFIDDVHGMVKLAHEARVQVQVGHHDWYRPVVRSSLAHVCHPQSIRFTDYLPGVPPGGSDSPVFRTIVADLDLALGLAGSTVRKVRPHASRLLDGDSFEIDIRVELHNGTLISLVVRKFASVPERRLEIIQPDGIITMDLLNQFSSMEDFPADGEISAHQRRVLWPPEGDDQAAARRVRPGEEESARQCLSFIHALEKGRHSLSSLEGGFKALEITRQIETVVGSF
jgi:predicted dehydrogenase